MTTTRILCLGQVRIEVPLEEISDAVVAGGVLRLAIGEGRGLAIRTDDPLVLRVEIAAARGAARTAAGGSPGGRNARGGATPDAPEG